MLKVALVWVVLVGLPLAIFTVTSGEVSKCGESEGIKDCCPCYRDNKCNDTCPDGYIEVLQRVLCEEHPNATNVTTVVMATTESTVSTTTSTLLTTTVTALEDEIDGNGSEPITTEPPTTTEKPKHPEVKTCLKNCFPNTFYDINQTKCIKCHEACIECSGRGSDKCKFCKFKYNNTCFPSCPTDTVKEDTDKNGTVKCVPVDDSKTDGKNLGTILGAAIGGGVVLLIALIIIIACCRHRRVENSIRRSEKKTRSRTAMSEILASNEPDKDDTKTPRQQTTALHRPANYQNTDTLPAGTNLGQEVQRAHDKVTRYTPDPTSGKVNGQGKDTEPVSEEEYGNAPMINLQSKHDTKGMSQDELEESIQIEQLPAAPLPPGVSQKKGTSGVKTKKKATKKLVQQPNAQDGPTQDYLPMDGTSGQPVADDELEPYENTTFQMGKDTAITNKNKNPSKSKSTTSGAKYTKRGGHGTNVVNETKGGNPDLEDYENTKEFKKEEKTADLEDYENTSTLKRTKQDNVVTSEDDLDDYENTKELKIENIYQNVNFGK